MAIYLKFDKEIKGEVTAEGFEGQVEVGSLQWGVGIGVSSPTGSANREASIPSFSEVVVTKSTDIASTPLFKETCGRENFKTVTISFTTTAKGNSNLVFLEIKLENVIISGYSMSSGGDGRPSESLSLNYTKITMKYMLDEKGTLAAKAPEVAWDLATNKA
ncbi:MAG: type VI secretion system tube protein Hcp [Gemmatimonadaceae bacterium]|jgi:type VI secretion system secreted protein Hcp|nr:type VI secretion system tube protein Hcp [Reyranella sp.]MBX9855768.1 type VI secretion system tube protein Hcp [Gemmatimonadaceae bacterium]